MFWNLYDTFWGAAIMAGAVVAAMLLFIIATFYIAVWWHEHVAPKLIARRKDRRLLEQARLEARSIHLMLVGAIITPNEARILARKAIDELAQQQSRENS